MIDTVHADVIQTLPEVGYRILLIHIAVHRQQEPFTPGTFKHLPEFERRIVPFIRIETDSQDQVFVRQRGLQGFHG